MTPTPGSATPEGQACRRCSDTRFAAIDGGTGGDGPMRSSGDRAWNERHPDCTVCRYTAFARRPQVTHRALIDRAR